MDLQSAFLCALCENFAFFAVKNEGELKNSIGLTYGRTKDSCLRRNDSWKYVTLPEPCALCNTVMIDSYLFSFLSSLLSPPCPEPCALCPVHSSSIHVPMSKSSGITLKRNYTSLPTALLR
jgi:hypothetical protein